MPKSIYATCPYCGEDGLMADVARHSTDGVSLKVELDDNGAFAGMVEQLWDPDIYAVEIETFFCSECGEEFSWNYLEAHLKEQYPGKETN